MMLDRVLKLIVTLTMLVFLLQAVIGLLAGLVGAALRPFASAVGSFGGIASGLVVLAALACLMAGLLVRARQLVLSRNPRAARDRAAVRTRVRRPAEHVPVHEPEEHLPDPDPAINEEDE